MPHEALSTGIRMGYEQQGPPHGEPLLLLPPLARNRSAWGLQAPAFAAKMRCILPDTRGTGESDDPGTGWSLGTFAQDAVALLDALGEGSVHVAGWSMGSAVAMELALGWPERVRSLSLYTPWARTDSDLRACFQIQADLVEHAPPRCAEAAVTWMLFTPGYLNREWAALHEAIDAAVATPGHRSTAALLGHLTAAREHDVLGRLASISAPTFLIAAEGDRLVPVHHAHEVHEAIPGARLHLFRGQGASHGVPLERTAEFNSAACMFFDEVTRAGGP